MKYLGSAMNELQITDQQGSTISGRMGRRQVVYDDNLHAERRRREKLSDRLLALRAIVPVITNMNKATIIEDAITYIQELQRNVKVLRDMLLEMDATSKEGTKPKVDEIDLATGMLQRGGIKEDVQVTNTEENELWIKTILEKKKGWLIRLIEKIISFGLKLNDIYVTSYKGEILILASVEGACGDSGTHTVQQTKELLLQIIKSS